MKKMIKKILIILTVTTFVLAGCRNIGSDSEKTPDSSATKYVATLKQQAHEPFSSAYSDGLNEYGLNVLNLLNDGNNVCISPASLELALLMTTEGAQGETRDELLNALSMSGMSSEEIQEASRQLMWRLNQNGMQTGNSIWLQNDFPFDQGYLDICTEAFMSDMFLVDFEKDADATKNDINTWTSEKTNERIPKIIDSPLDPMTRLVLVNAVFFLGEWETPFKPDNTYEEAFHGHSAESETEFMHAKFYTSYYASEDFSLISLPFDSPDEKEDNTFEMAFILPDEDSNIEELIANLSGGKFDSAINASTYEETKIALPKFEFDYATGMVGPMQDLGASQAFTDAAEFDVMTGSPNDLFVSEILHKTYIRVDEEGAEAAAATAVIVGTTAMPVEEEFKVFTADRPFIFTIYDRLDNTILFIGIVSDLG